jgi:hypothetical protein
MNKKIILLLACSFLGAYIHAAERKPLLTQEASSQIEYVGKIYTLTAPQSQQYQQIMRGKDEKIKTAKLQLFFTAIEEDFPQNVTKTEALKQQELLQEQQQTAALLEQEKLRKQQEEDATRAEYFDIGIKLGMNAEDALKYVEEQMNEASLRAPILPVAIGPDGIPHHTIPQSNCPEHPQGACSCANAQPEEQKLEQCAVCKADLLPQEAQDFSVTLCGHTFHSQCLTRATATQKKCPICRVELKNIPQLTEETTPRLFPQAAVNTPENEEAEITDALEQIRLLEQQQEEPELANALAQVHLLEQEEAAAINNTLPQARLLPERAPAALVAEPHTNTTKQIIAVLLIGLGGCVVYKLLKK